MFYVIVIKGEEYTLRLCQPCSHCILCNWYMHRYVANITLIPYVAIEYKREVYMEFKLV
jgi:hypothetical protein